MNPYVMEVCCDICGEKGMATINSAADQWLGVKLRHTDPRICAENLRRKKEELDRREKKERNK